MIIWISPCLYCPEHNAATLNTSLAAVKREVVYTRSSSRPVIYSSILDRRSPIPRTAELGPIKVPDIGMGVTYGHINTCAA